MARAPGTVVVFDDIGEKTDVPDFGLCRKAAVSVIVRRDGRSVVPALFAVAENGLVKVKHTGEVTVFTDKVRQFPGLFVKYFAYGKGVVFSEGAVAHFSQKLSDSGCLFQHGPDVAQPVFPVGFIAVQGQRLFDIDNGVDAETAKAFFQPPVHIFIDFLPNLGIFPVQIGLLFVEHMEILFVGARQIFPHGSAEVGAPVGGQFPFLFIPQIKISAVFSIGIFTGFAEPLVLVGAVVHHKVHKNIHVTLFCFGYQPVHVLHGTKTGINAVIIGDIIALIG